MATTFNSTGTTKKKDTRPTSNPSGPRDSGVVNNAPTASTAPTASSSPTVSNPFDPTLDPIYNQAVGAGGSIDSGLANLRSYLTGQDQQLGSQLGVNITGDPLGDPSGVSYSIDPNVDISNPFSKAAALKTAYQQGTTGNTTSYAARGQLYAGSLQNAQNAQLSNYNQGNNDLINEASTGISGLIGQWLQAQQNATSATTSAANDAFQRWLAAQGLSS